MLRLLVAIGALWLAFAQAPAEASCTAPCTKGAITTDISTNWPDNTIGAITPALLRSTVAELLGSYVDANGASSLSCAAHQWISAIPTLSSITCAQPAITDISGLGTGVSALLGGNATGSGAPVGGTSPTINGATLSGTTNASATFQIAADWYLTAATTPTTLSGDVNNYNPSGLATTNYLRINGGAANRNITGLTAGTAGRQLILTNVGTTNNLVLKNLSGSSTAANQFNFGGDVTLAPSQSITLIYDSTLSNWIGVGSFTSLGGTPTGTVTSVTCGNGLSGGTFTVSGTCAYSGGARFQSSNAGLSPASTSSSTEKMAGLGSTCTITPTVTGRIRFHIWGAYSLVGAQFGKGALYYGTGTAPTNGAATTGTKLTVLLDMQEPLTLYLIPFSMEGNATGFTLGTAVWFDLSQLSVNNSAAFAYSDVMCSAEEF